MAALESGGSLGPKNILSGPVKEYFLKDAIHSKKIDTYNNFVTQFFAKHFSCSVEVKTDTGVYHVKRKDFETWCREKGIDKDFDNFKSLDSRAAKYILNSFNAQ